MALIFRVWGFLRGTLGFLNSPVELMYGGNIRWQYSSLELMLCTGADILYSSQYFWPELISFTLFFQVEHDMALLGEEKKELDDKKLVHDAQV